VIARDDTTASSPDARENEERGLRTAEMKAARELAEHYGGDPHAADWRASPIRKPARPRRWPAALRARA